LSHLLIHVSLYTVNFMMNLLSCRCDVCTNGPPQRQNLKEEACILLQTIGAHNVCLIFHIYIIPTTLAFNLFVTLYPNIDPWTFTAYFSNICTSSYSVCVFCFYLSWYSFKMINWINKCFVSRSSGSQVFAFKS
jgi:hypothetical protein